MNISKIRELVDESKLSKVQIAEKCGFTRKTLENIMNGEVDAKISSIEALANALGVEVGYFFDEESEGARIAVADRGGRATAGDNSPIGADSSACNTELVDSLHRQIEYLNSIISAKDEIISLLKSQSPTP